MLSLSPLKAFIYAKHHSYKKDEESLPVPDEIISLPVETSSANCEAEQVKTNSPNLSRPARVKKLPQERKDFVLT